MSSYLEDKTVCTVCYKKVLDRGIECDDKCKRWFHPECIRMSGAEYKKYADGVNKVWKCGRVDCLDSIDTQLSTQSLSAQFNDIISRLDRLAGVPKDISEMKAEVTVISEKLSVLELRIVHVEKRLDDLEANLVTNLEARISSIESKVEAASPGLSNMSLCPESVIEEISERNRRSRNVILYKIAESNSPNVEVKKSHDKSKVECILDALEVAADEYATFFRIGKKTTKGPRPIKLIMKSNESAVNILKRFSLEKLVHLDQTLSEVAISNDKTPQERNHLSSLRDELARRSEAGENDLTIRYINGIPKIVTIKKTSQIQRA